MKTPTNFKPAFAVSVFLLTVSQVSLVHAEDYIYYGQAQPMDYGSTDHLTPGYTQGTYQGGNYGRGYNTRPWGSSGSGLSGPLDSGRGGNSMPWNSGRGGSGPSFSGPWDSGSGNSMPWNSGRGNSMPWNSGRGGNGPSFSGPWDSGSGNSMPWNSGRGSSMPW